MRVWSYYQRGQGLGPILGELTPCLEIDTKKGSSTSFECTRPAGSTVPKGATVSAWSAWLVPQGDEIKDVTVQFVHQGVVRTTKDLSLRGETFRVRTYASAKLDKPGKWEIVVRRGAAEVSRASIHVE